MPIDSYALSRIPTQLAESIQKSSQAIRKSQQKTKVHKGEMRIDFEDEMRKLSVAIDKAMKKTRKKKPWEYLAPLAGLIPAVGVPLAVGLGAASAAGSLRRGEEYDKEKLAKAQNIWAKADPRWQGNWLSGVYGDIASGYETEFEKFKSSIDKAYGTEDYLASAAMGGLSAWGTEAIGESIGAAAQAGKAAKAAVANPAAVGQYELLTEGMGKDAISKLVEATPELAGFASKTPGFRAFRQSLMKSMTEPNKLAELFGDKQGGTQNFLQNLIMLLSSTLSKKELSKLFS